eukprot:3112076-Ditylum_brightwellii.AAC.1
MVSYYALIEERSKTLVIFTSDHGEHLGSHGRVERKSFYEEAIHAPIILSLLGNIPAGKIINILTSNLDLFSTILDYTGNSEFDKLDGVSLRHFVEGTNMNKYFNDEVAVTESDFRVPSPNSA